MPCASMTCTPSTGSAAAPLATRVMRSPSTSTSAENGAAPLPSQTTQLRISVFIGSSPRVVVHAGLACRGQTPQRKAAVCTGASHSASVALSAALTVIEQPAISSEVT